MKDFLNDLKIEVKEIFRGLYNFWKFRKEIYNYRWYDYGFAHDIFRAVLADMRDNWKDAHYVNSEKEEKILREAVQLLDEIKKLEDKVDLTTETENKRADLYEKFGKLLFKKEIIFENDHVKAFSCNFMKLWD